MTLPRNVRRFAWLWWGAMAIELVGLPQAWVTVWTAHEAMVQLVVVICLAGYISRHLLSVLLAGSLEAQKLGPMGAVAGAYPLGAACARRHTGGAVPALVCRRRASDYCPFGHRLLLSIHR